MSKKLFGNADIKVVRNESVRGVWIPPSEMKEVLNLVGEIGYALYTFYRTYPFKEDEEFHDFNVAELLGWGTKKVQKYRLVLEKNELLLSVRYGTKIDGITKVFVGMEPVALFNAGLPADVINPKALNKLKKRLCIQNTQELVSNINSIISEYETNPLEYS